MDEALREFLVESGENLSQMELDLVHLEDGAGDSGALPSIFRTIHTIKGTCGFLGFPELERLTHAGENLLAKLRDGVLVPNAEITQALLALVDAARASLREIESTGREGSGSGNEELLARLEGLARGAGGGARRPGHEAPSGGDPPGGGGSAPDDDPPPGGAPPPTARQGRKRSQPGSPSATAGAARPAKRRRSPEAAVPSTDVAAHAAPSSGPAAGGEGAGGSADDRAVEGVVAGPEINGGVAASTIRVDVGVLDRLMDLVGELVLVRNQVVELASDADDPRLTAVSQRIDHVTSELQEGVVKTRMQPIDRIWRGFPRLVRDLAGACDKRIALFTEGADTELDKSVIEAIKDPLTHLVRNAVDHGIEVPDARRAAGKPEEGRVALRAFHESGQVILEVADDGSGISPERTRRRAVELGLVSPERAARLTEAEAMALIFLPGLSTAKRVTSLSGRGVGLDVVRTNVERIGGSVDVASSSRGTTFTIRIPLTLAIVPALIVSSAGERFAIPQASLLELVRLGGGRDVEMLHGAAVFRLREKLLPIVDLARELELELGAGPAGSEETPRTLVILSADGRSFGLVVEAVEESQEIVVKSVGPYLKRIPLLAGATILGNGQVALILDVLGLALRAHVVRTGRDRVVAKAEQPAPVVATERRQKLLFFRSRDDGRMAVPLDKVARLEEFERSAVEKAGDFDVVQYRGMVLPLFYVDSLLPERRKRPRSAVDGDDAEKMSVVVYADKGRMLGLVVDGVEEIVEEPVAPQRPGSRRGVLGTIIVQDRVTELLDIPGIVASVDPEFFEAVTTGGTEA